MSNFNKPYSDLRKSKLDKKDFDKMIVLICAVSVLYFGGHVILWVLR